MLNICGVQFISPFSTTRAQTANKNSLQHRADIKSQLKSRIDSLIQFIYLFYLFPKTRPADSVSPTQLCSLTEGVCERSALFKINRVDCNLGVNQVGVSADTHQKTKQG